MVLASPQTDSPQGLERRPLASVRQVSLFCREVRERLSAAAIEILFGRVDVLSEGKFESGEFFATVMLTFDLASAVELRDSADTATARQLAEQMASDPRVRQRALEIAGREAARLAQRRLRGAQTDVRIRAAGSRVHVDIDLQGRPEPTG